MDILEKLLAAPSLPVPNASIVIFGATGDLVTDHGVRKALGDLVDEQDLKPSKHRLLFTSRRCVEADKYLDDLKNGDKKDTPLSDETIKRLKTIGGLDADNATLISVDFKNKEPFANLPEFGEDEVVLFYGALPPSVFGQLMEDLVESKLLVGHDHRRLILEKPFGEDLQAAVALAKKVQKNIPTQQVYLVDHFLAYPGMLEWLSLRSRPGIQEAMTKAYVCPQKGVHIILNETILSNDRAYFRETGVLEDMLQNHAMQVLANSCMELSGAETAEAWRHHRQQVISSLEWREGDAPRAQVEGFNDPAKGAPQGAEPSSVETFASIGFTLNLARWQGIPMRMTAGKGVNETRFGLDIHLKKLPQRLADEFKIEADQEACIQIDIHSGKFGLRVGSELYPLEPPLSQPDRPAYSRVFLDALHGEHAFFVDPEESVAAWRFIDKIQQFWRDNPSELRLYPPGTPVSELIPRDLVENRS